MHPYRDIWNCCIYNDKYIFQISTGPRTEYCASTLEYYVDCNTGETGFIDIGYSDNYWNLIEGKRKKKGSIVWIDLSDEEAYHSDAVTKRLRNRLLSANLMEKE